MPLSILFSFPYNLPSLRAEKPTIRAHLYPIGTALSTTMALLNFLLYSCNVAGVFCSFYSSLLFKTVENRLYIVRHVKISLMRQTAYKHFPFL